MWLISSPLVVDTGGDDQSAGGVEGLHLLSYRFKLMPFLRDTEVDWTHCLVRDTLVFGTT